MEKRPFSGLMTGENVSLVRASRKLQDSASREIRETTWKESGRKARGLRSNMGGVVGKGGQSG
eukprot:487521-Rhodomonas_salina.1